MENKPGISWGLYETGPPWNNSCRVNLMRSSKGWLAVYYDNHESKGEIIKIFNPKSIVDYYAMLKTLSEWNYGTCRLCPIVKMEMEYG